MCLPPRKNGLRRLQMARVIDIEKRVKRSDRPIGNGARVALQKIPGLAHILLDESMAKIPSDRDRPSAIKECVRPPKLAQAVMSPCVLEADAKIIWQERRIGRRADSEFRVPVMRGDPIESGENARERTLETRHIVGGDRQVKFREPRRIAIGVQNEAVALRPQRRDDAREQAHSAKDL
jgi:hypothetical protein